MSVLRLAVIAVLSVLVVACGGGGGGGTPSNDPAPVQPQQPPPADPQALAAHLGGCPNGPVIDEKLPCMTGVYEGRTTSDGAYCALRYAADGTTSYATGTQSLRVVLSLTFSGAVFEKKAAANDAGFSVDWTVGIGTSNPVDILYKFASEPASAAGLLIRPRKASFPACLVTSAPTRPAQGASSTANLLGRHWSAPQRLNGSGALGLFSDQPAFDAGLADDGHGFIAFRQPDASGRQAVFVVDGRSGAAWSSPLQLDAAAPLAVGNFKPHLAVSANGHAVITWMAELPCEADAYEVDPVGKTCRYVYATRRLAGEPAWETAQRVRASPPMAAQDHFVRINARGDTTIAFPSFIEAGSTLTATMLAVRPVANAGWRAVRLRDHWSNSLTTEPFADKLFVRLGDDGALSIAGNGVGAFSGVARARVDIATVPDLQINATPNESGVHVYDLRTSGGYAAYTFKEQSGPYDRLTPEKMTIYSPATQAWLAPYDLAAYALYGDAVLAATDDAAGEFLVYAGCRVTAWRAGSWGATRKLPDYCGRDVAGGVYAFNRAGDYLGIDWANQPGQWGYYSRAQDKLLKGAPGSASTTADDLVLGTPVRLFDAANTQLHLAPAGRALLVTGQPFDTLPSAANPAGVASGAGHRLWAIHLN